MIPIIMKRKLSANNHSLEREPLNLRDLKAIKFFHFFGFNFSNSYDFRLFVTS